MTDSVHVREDVIDSILGLDNDSAIKAIRQQFPQNQAEFQAYYDALFVPTDSSLLSLPLSSRLLAAVRTAAHTSSTSVLRWDIQQAEEAGVTTAEINAAQNLVPTSTGDPTLNAIYAHIDLLVSHPVDSSREALTALANAGLSPAGIVSLSQIVALVSYQIRFVSVLRAVGSIS